MKTHVKILAIFIDFLTISTFLFLLFWSIGPKNICEYNQSGKCYLLISIFFITTFFIQAAIYFYGYRLHGIQLLIAKIISLIFVTITAIVISRF